MKEQYNVTQTSTAAATAAKSTGYHEVPWARITVLVDNNRDPEGRLMAAWGISMLVETPNGSVLFDTGPNPSVLKANAKLMNIDLCNVTAIVISHEHGDHVGGLPYIARKCPSKPVYVPAGVPESLIKWLYGLGLRNIKLVNETTEVIPGVVVLKPLYGPPWEQALTVLVDDGFVLLVGCSHPGVTRLAMEAIETLHRKPLLVIGGFHMFASPLSECRKVVEKLVELGFEKIAPIHCSGDTLRSITEEIAPSRYLPAHVGTVLLVTKTGIEVDEG